MTDATEDRLRAYGRSVGPVLDLTDLQRRVARRRRRRLLVDAVSCVTVAAVMLVGVLVVKPSASAPRNGTADTAAPSSPDRTEATLSTAGATSSSAAPTSSVAPTTTTPLVMPGRTGLMLDHDAVPDGWEPVIAHQSRGEEVLTRSGTTEIESETTLAAYSGDRTQIVDTITIEVLFADQGHTAASLGDGQVTSMRGLEAYATDTSVAWQEMDRIFLVRTRGSTPGVLVEVAEGLDIGADGEFTIGRVPDGYELIEKLPGSVEDVGPAWQTSYASPLTIDTDKPDVILDVVTNPGESLESLLARDGHAVDLAGRRAIVRSSSPGNGSTFVYWDLPGGARASLWYDPLTPAATEQDLVDEAVALGRAARLATDDEWSALQADAEANAATRASRPWISSGLATRGLVAAGASSQIPGIQLTAVLVPAGPVADQQTHTCEFLRTTLVTCTSIDPRTWDPTLTATLIAERYVRIATGPGIPLVGLKYETGEWNSNVLPLFNLAESPGVGYIPLQPDRGAGCALARTTDGTTLASAPIAGQPTLPECRQS
jgi:hypothetical protein